MERLLSIIIVTYNCKDDLFEGIESINRFYTGNCEIIVVDNASTDGTAEETTLRFPKVNYIFNQSNIGFSAACNQGFRISNGEVLFFMNPDAKLLDDHLPNAIDFLSTHYPAVMGPEVLNPDGSIQESVIKIPNAAGVWAEALFFSYFQKRQRDKLLAENKFALSGAALLMFRSVFERLDGFDEDLFWMDDVDLCFRARQKDVKLIYFNEWKVQHKIGVSTRKNYRKVISNQLISKLKFFRKNKMTFSWLAALIAIKFQIFSRVILFFILSPFKNEFRQKCLAYCYSLYALTHYIFTGDKKIY